ncbi:MAG: citrate synthase, partial [Firmicutes bacterium]|nr:citrate synthase [Bacillota bacterium]
MAEITKAEARAIFERLCEEHIQNIRLDPSGYELYKVKRGLRNSDGTGVVAGITRIGNVQGYIIQDNEPVAIPGKLFYRGIDVEELIAGCQAEDRFGFEETAFLLLFGELPTQAQLDDFVRAMEEYRALPYRFTEDMILAAPSQDVMNKLGRGILALYSYDQNDPEDNSYTAQMEKAMYLIARCPVIVAHGLAAKQHYHDHAGLHLFDPQPGLSTAENFLYSVRRDNHYSKEEARLLDLCLIMHAEHGGGNNSAFACRVLSSSGTDIYSAISAAVGSLKGPKHGGANKKVMEQFRVIESEVSDWDDETAVRRCLMRIASEELGDGSGLIYGLGHAVYTISDPRT